jgi:RNA polymerase sigma-70 factor, ECF subfamily
MFSKIFLPFYIIDVLLLKSRKLIDLNIISALRKGDTESFTIIVRELTTPMLRLAGRIVTNTEEAEDIVQECFLKVWEKRASIKDNQSFMAWLRRIVINRCYDFLRKEKRKNGSRVDIDAVHNISASLTEEADARINEEEVSDILAYLTEGLSPRQKIVYVLSELEGYSNQEISKSTGMNENAVKSNLHHARKSAREAYKRIEKIM